MHDENEKVTYRGSSVGDMPVYDKLYAWYPWKQFVYVSIFTGI